MSVCVCGGGGLWGWGWGWGWVGRLVLHLPLLFLLLLLHAVYMAGRTASMCSQHAAPSPSLQPPSVSNMPVCVCPACLHICQCNGRMVKTEVLPWAYWNLMMKGFVPWSEAKNAIKAIKARLQQWRETTASLPQ